MCVRTMVSWICALTMTSRFQRRLHPDGCHLHEPRHCNRRSGCRRRSRQGPQHYQGTQLHQLKHWQFHFAASLYSLFKYVDPFSLVSYSLLTRFLLVSPSFLAHFRMTGAPYSLWRIWTLTLSLITFSHLPATLSSWTAFHSVFHSFSIYSAYCPVPCANPSHSFLVHFPVNCIPCLVSR